MAGDARALLDQLSGPERKVLAALRGSRGATPVEAVVARAGFKSADEAFSAASWLQRKGFAEISEERDVTLALGPEGRRFLDQGLPERRAYDLVRGSGGDMAVDRLRELLGDDAQIAMAWWKRSGLGSIQKEGTATVLSANAKPPPDEGRLVLERIARGEAADADPNRLRDLRGRPGVLSEVLVLHRKVKLTELGRTLSSLEVDAEAGIGELTPELLRSGAWRGKAIRGYDVLTESPRVFPGKPHPLVQIIEEIRQIFVELGFEEISEEYVQSAFWNLDALFIPQDHPARDMQDTFYLETPARLEVPMDLVRRISEVHRSGQGADSRGWGQPLDPEESSLALLRTHTTVGTIRHLARNPKGSKRTFIIGRVFRKETMDATHLPEFHQIEGIATEPGADFPMLLGILQEFYRRLGFPTLRWRPAYFPYTEPSMEVEVWTGKRWMELGGCGIFRPEVTRPLGVETPVLAWGLGLERLAMMRLGRQDIRDLYLSDLEWLRSQPLL